MKISFSLKNYIDTAAQSPIYKIKFLIDDFLDVPHKKIAMAFFLYFSICNTNHLIMNGGGKEKRRIILQEGTKNSKRRKNKAIGMYFCLKEYNK